MCMYVYNTTTGISLSLSVVCLWNKHEHWDALLIGMILLCFIELYCVQKGLEASCWIQQKGIARNPYTMLLQRRARPIHVPVQTGSQFTSYCRSWLRLVGRFLLSFHRDEAILIGPAEQFEVAIAATFVRMMQEGQFTISFPGWPLGSMTIHDIWGLGDLCSQFFIWVSCPFSVGGGIPTCPSGEMHKRSGKVQSVSNQITPESTRSKVWNTNKHTFTFRTIQSWTEYLQKRKRYREWFWLTHNHTEKIGPGSGRDLKCGKILHFSRIQLCYSQHLLPAPT